MHRHRAVTPSRYYAFGPYVLDRYRGVLWHEGAAVPVTPKAFEVLSTFVEHPGELLTKDELLRRVWPGVTVEENNLARHISTIRRTLGDRPGQREYIATLPGAGYRFVADVRVLDELPHTGDRRTPADAAAPAVHAPADALPAAVLPAAREATRSGPGRLVLAAAVLLVMAVGGGASWLVMRTGVTRLPSPERVLQQLTYESGLQQDASWSPDGHRIAYASDRLGNTDIWIQAIDDATPPVRLTSSGANDWQPAWSPDGRTIAFRSERDGGGLYLMPASGGPERLLCTVGTHPRWSPRGDRLLVSRAGPETAGATQLLIVDVATGATRAIDEAALAGVSVVNGAWHPDGRLSVWGRDARGDWVLLTVADAGATAVSSIIPADVQAQIASGALNLSSLTWAPSGRFLYFEGLSDARRHLWRVRVNSSTLAWEGALERLTNGPTRNAGLGLSPDGRRLAFSVSTPKLTLWSYAFDGGSGRLTGEGHDVTPGDADEQAMDASADGRRLVYRALRSDRSELWERSANADPRLLVSTREWRYSLPRWSPDGTRVAYQRTRNSGARVERAISILAVDNREEHELSVPQNAVMVPGDWRADGGALLGGCRMPGQAAMGTCVMPVDGGPAEQIAYDPSADLVQHRYSPDQHWVSFGAIPTTNRSTTRLYVMRAAGGAGWTALTDGTAYDDKPRWSPDGRTVYFVSNRGGRPDVWGRRFDPVAGRPEGGIFRVTAFDRGPRILAPFLRQLGMVISADRLFLPMYEATGHLWVLDQVDQ